MALDWSKEISFSGLGKSKSASKASDAYPTKTYMNLAVADRKTIEIRRVIPTAIVLLVVVALFAKFGVIDFVGQVTAKQAELSQQQQKFADVEAQLSTYSDVLDEYSMYVSSKLTDDGVSVSTIEALNLVDAKIRPIATVSTLSYSKNVLTLSLANASLTDLSNLMSSLNEEPIVANVQVSNTGASQGTSSSNVQTSMIVTLQKAGASK